jgi:ubiquinone/menaquinone biosynthesis C-methylase UbiE
MHTTSSTSTTPGPSRYAKDWNAYSEMWQDHYGQRYQHLGDEWCDDGSEARHWERRLLTQAAEPWLSPRTRLLEIGPGGGKWTVRLAPKVGAVTAFDVADAMLDRTKQRCESEGLTNVSFVLGNGRDLTPLADESHDLVWSYDVFVHIALEDTVAYLLEIARVLREGGVAVIHHAVNDNADAWDRIESHNDWYRQGHTLGQYYYHSRDALVRMYSRAGLRVKTMWSDYCTVVVTAEKPYDSVAPDLERALRLMATAATDDDMAAAVYAVEAVGRDIEHRLAMLVVDAQKSRPGQSRHAAIQRIRRLIRG